MRHCAAFLRVISPRCSPSISFRASLAAAAVVLTSVSLAAQSPAVVRAADQPARDRLKAATIEKLDRYMAQYEPQLSALVADEVFRQATSPLSSTDLRPYITRRLDSEVAFARLPDEVNWIGFRRVMKVDGVAVAHTGPALAALLSLGPTDRRAQAQHKALGLLVPTRMDEVFLIAGSAPGKGRATYSNFRRFQTSARIVPQ